jgi:hypothetical protein
MASKRRRRPSTRALASQGALRWVARYLRWRILELANAAVARTCLLPTRPIWSARVDYDLYSHAPFPSAREQDAPLQMCTEISESRGAYAVLHCSHRVSMMSMKG